MHIFRVPMQRNKTIYEGPAIFNASDWIYRRKSFANPVIREVPLRVCYIFINAIQRVARWNSQTGSYRDGLVFE
jgi:hypothetical protein